ncbi:glycerophosphodiester phosphodiesterase, partial [Sinorhizobium medicae]
MRDLSWLKAQPIAHRGFHDMNREVWENTLSAFSRAAEAGFAIECDLQFAADSIPVVFHDHDLRRLCGIAGDVRAKTSAELGLLSVGGTSDKVPTLTQMLRLVAGRVPLIIELKGRTGDDEGFAAAVLDTLEGY